MRKMWRKKGSEEKKAAAEKKNYTGAQMHERLFFWIISNEKLAKLSLNNTYLSVSYADVKDIFVGNLENIYIHRGREEKKTALSKHHDVAVINNKARNQYNLR